MPRKTSINDFSGSAAFFEALSRLKVLIIGDVMVDSYLWGKVDRISPEAPVPVVLLQKKDKRLGGAANVALNIQSLGAMPFLCSVIGNDPEGDDFLKLLQEKGLSSEGIITSPDRITTVKQRIISSDHHLLRLDSEQDHVLTERETIGLKEKISRLLKDCDVVIFEDYDKGVLSETLISEVIAECNRLGLPTVVDPKKRNFLTYKQASLFKPNKKELREGLKLDNSLNDLAEVQDAVRDLKQRLNCETIMITLSNQGIYVEGENQTLHYPAHKRAISDVSGAGDTVVSVAALCYAVGLPIGKVASLANLAGGIVCEQVGVMPIQKALFQKEIIRLNLL